MLISALLFAFLNHFLDLPGKIPGLGWLLIFNTLIAGLITSFINARLLEPITRLSKAMKAVSQGDFEQHLETNSRIAEIGESYQSFNVMTKELRATEMLQMDFVSNVSHEFKTPINAIEGYTMLLQGDELSQEQEGYVEKILFNTQRLSGLVGKYFIVIKAGKSEYSNGKKQNIVWMNRSARHFFHWKINGLKKELDFRWRWRRSDMLEMKGFLCISG